VTTFHFEFGYHLTADFLDRYSESFLLGNFIPLDFSAHDDFGAHVIQQ
jgi:hypothetical protein